jgi:hypothetical protein
MWAMIAGKTPILSAEQALTCGFAWRIKICYFTATLLITAKRIE